MPDALLMAEPLGLDHVAEYDAIVIGAGISGMFMLYRLRQLGMTTRVFEAGSDVGGTWYWNRYPGARFDSESWTYGYSFSKELLQEWDWKEHFSPQPDTLEYLNLVADKFDLRRDMQFRSTVTAAHWDDDENMWTVTLESGQRARARFLLTAVGILSAYTLPAIPGRDSFRGPAYHPARWPKEKVDFTGKRVGVIGTGATAIQAIPEIAKQCKHLTVFQRRPNWAAPLHNSKIGKQEMAAIKARYDEIYARCRETPSWFIHQADPRRTLDVPPEEREAFWEKLYAEPGFGIWMGNFRDILTDEKANAAVTEFIAKKIRQRVKDPKVAEKLIPKDHGFGTRRVPLESGYFEAYNRDNVSAGRSERNADRAHHPERRQDQRQGIRIRHSGLRHGFRRRDRRVRPHRYQRSRRRQAEGCVGRGAAHLSRLDARGFPEHADGAGSAYRARQHPSRRRARRRMPHRAAANSCGRTITRASRPGPSK